MNPPSENPTEEEISQYVTEARKIISGGLRQFSANQLEENRKMKEERKNEAQGAVEAFLLAVHDDRNSGNYPGFDKAADDRCLEIMKKTGRPVGPADIVVLPSNAGMSAKNTAITVLSEDQLDTFRTIVATQHGKTAYAQDNPYYRGLLDRIRIGTILIAAELANDGNLLPGTIWHECGHKFEEEKTEAGCVFAWELRMLREHEPAKVRDWVMKVRTPAYLRDYGLRTDPGRKELLLLLQEICPEEVFYAEFKARYQEIMGEELPKPESVARDETAKARLDVRIGTEVKGTLKSLRTQLEGHPLAGPRNSVLPNNAQPGALVTFAGKKWELLGKTAEFPIEFALRCVDLDDAQVTRRGTVWAKVTDGTTTFGLVEAGPWPYADAVSAQADQEIVFSVVDRTMADFAKADQQTVFELTVKYVLETKETR